MAKNNATLASGGSYGGAFTNSLMLTGAATTNSGNYTVAVANAGGSVTSSVASVSISLPPQVTAAASSAGTVQFNANTVTDLTYMVLIATNLSSTWTAIQTNTTGATGAVNFQTNTAGAPNQFFRLDFQ